MTKYCFVLLLLLLCSFNINNYAYNSINKINDNYTLSDSTKKINIDTLNLKTNNIINNRIKHFNDSGSTVYDNISTFDKFSEDIVKRRMEYLNLHSPIELKYNREVKEYINIYLVKHKYVISKIAGLSQYYFPIFEETLDKYGLPLELKYLPIVESELDPFAGSSAGARGLWQFMYNTGKVYGLIQTSFIDERLDTYKSTEAACKYLKDLYDIYDDWLLAIAAYNSGVGNINKAIKRSGGKRNFWDIWNYLPKETRAYVPAFTSMVYIMTYYKDYGILPNENIIPHLLTDTIIVKSKQTFSSISKKSGASIDEIRLLNPQYRLGVVPGSKEMPLTVILSKKNALIYTDVDNIKPTNKDNQPKSKSNLETKDLDRIIYKVEPGDNLSKIAEKHNTTVNNIIEWNNLPSTLIQIDQELIIYKKNY
ncbi:MAG: transglycosylase SLT domain-containing protein [Bacteroidales bacterium]|jgi:membrane-bound lytic murein transglycosylase D